MKTKNTKLHINSRENLTFYCNLLNFESSRLGFRYNDNNCRLRDITVMNCEIDFYLSMNL